MRKGRIAVIDRIDGRSAAALLVDGKLHDLLIDPPDDGQPHTGEIYAGKTLQPMKGQNGIVVDLGDGRRGFLKQAKGIAPGTPMLVQVATFAEGDKAPSVTQQILFKGRYAIVTPDAPGINVARAIRDEEERERLLEIAHECLAEAPAGLGLILRSACNGVAAEPIEDELAQLLGFEYYAVYSLATKMAETPEQVVSFLNDLAGMSRPQAEKEYQQLQDFALEEFSEPELESWDISYYSEKLKQARYAISQEELRPYFPMAKVLDGMFRITGQLFAIEIEEVAEFDRWHKDARLFNISRDGELIARFFLDPYARAKKRGGAWMDDCRVRRIDNGILQLPVAYLVCNFNPPVGDKPALLTHNEVTTLFHEFGHGLHHMLTRIEYADVSGINGVAWDAVELPSQFLENWCYEAEALALISGHFETGEPLPQELLEKMLAAKNFQSGMMMVRQLELSLFDFQLHREYKAGVTNIQAVLDRIRREVAVITPPAFNRFQHSFSHIFAGGYAAGYYSYKWAEVLSADAFSRFEEEGVFNTDTGRSFRENILEMGGSKEPMALFVAFRGREPSVEALLRHSGITA